MLKQLINLFIKKNGRSPNALEMLQLKFKAAQQSGKGQVIEFPRDKITDWKTPRPTTMSNAEYGILKDEWFGKIIANTDDDLNTFLKKGIDAADDRFKNLTPNQRKDFLDMVDYRLKHGNEKFINDFTDAKGKMKDPPEDLAGGGIAGMLGEPTYQDEDHRVPYKEGLSVEDLPSGLKAEVGDPTPGWGLSDLVNKYFLYQKVLPGVGEETRKYLGEKFLNDLNAQGYSPKDFKAYIDEQFPGKASGGRVPYNGGKKVGRPKGQFWTTGKGGGENVVDPDFDELSADEWLFILKSAMAGDYGPIDYANGGRAGYKDGKGPKMSRRTFLKGLGALAALPVVGKFFKFTKPLTKTKALDLTEVPIKNAEGMPSWFKPLVNRVIKEGDNVTKQFAWKERQIIHSKKLGENQGVKVYQDLDNQTISVEYQSADNMGGIDDSVNLEYTAPQVIEPPVVKGGKLSGYGKGVKTKAEFEANEAYPFINPKDYKDVTFQDINAVNKVDDLISDTSALKQFGTNKDLTKKELEIAKQKRQRVKEIHDNPHEELAGSEPDWDDYAEGGRVSFKFGGKGKVLEGLAELMEQFFPGTTKLGKRSKPYPEKVQEKMDLRKAIADFHERQKNKKLRRIGDNNPPSPIEEEAVTNKKIRETIKADEKTLAKLTKEHNKKYGPGREGGDEPMSDALYKQMVEDHKKTVAIENRILENRIKINDPPTKDDYQYYSEQLDNPDADYYPVKGNETLAELEAMVKKADADEIAEKKYWQKVFEKDDKKQMEKYGVLVNRVTEKNKLYKEFPNITDHQVADILRTDLDGTINPRKIEAAKETLRKQTGSPWYTDPKTLTPEEELRKEFPGISDDLIKNILADDNPQRIAEVKAALKEALKMQEKGMGHEEIINIFKKKPTKHASGGLAGMLGE